MQLGEINSREFLFRSLLTIGRELSVFNLISCNFTFYFSFGHVNLPFNTGH